MNVNNRELVRVTSRAVRYGAKYEIALGMLAELMGVPAGEIDRTIDAEALAMVRDRLGVTGGGITK
jgi:hypothetical protein